MVRLSVSGKGAKIKVGRGGNIIPTDDGIPETLQPIGDSGFYRTPDVVDPDDCYNYPDSPICGGNPFSSNIANLSIQPSIDSVGRTSLTISPTLLFFKLPSFTIMYAPPGTRGEVYPNKSIPLSGGRGMDSKDFGHLKDGDDYIISIDTEFTFSRPPATTKKLECGEVRASIGIANNASGGKKTEPLGEIPYPPPDEIYIRDIYDKNYPAVPGKLGTLKSSYPSAHPFFISGNGLLIKKFLSRDCKSGARTANELASQDAIVQPESYGVQTRIIAGGLTEPIQVDFISKSIRLRDCKNQGSIDPPPFDYPPENCCMECCQSSPNENAANDALLKKILKKVEEIDKNQGDYPVNVETWDADPKTQGNQKKTITITDTKTAVLKVFEEFGKVLQSIGIEEFPIQYPDTMVEPVNEGIFKDVWDFLTPDKVRRITSIASLLDWQNDSTSAILGKWQRLIKQERTEQVKQPDGTTKSKKQTDIVVLPDIATVMEEQFKMQIQSIKAIGLLNDMLIKTLQESADTKLLLAETLTRLKQVEEYLDFESTEKKQKIAIQTTIPPTSASSADKQDLYKYLQPSNQEFRFDDWNGTNSLNDKLDKILQIIGNINAGTFNNSGES